MPCFRIFSGANRLDQKENQKPSQKKDFSLIRLKGLGSPEAKNQKTKLNHEEHED
jgi:hypothetical protein